MASSNNLGKKRMAEELSTEEIVIKKKIREDNCTVKEISENLIEGEKPQEMEIDDGMMEIEKLLASLKTANENVYNLAWKEARRKLFTKENMTNAMDVKESEVDCVMYNTKCSRFMAITTLEAHNNLIQDAIFEINENKAKGCGNVCVLNDDIQHVMAEAKCSRRKAYMALRTRHNDVFDAISDLKGKYKTDGSLGVNLEDIYVVMTRTNCSRGSAITALKHANMNVKDAIIKIESCIQSFSSYGSAMKKLISNENDTIDEEVWEGSRSQTPTPSSSEADFLIAEIMSQTSCSRNRAMAALNKTQNNSFYAILDVKGYYYNEKGELKKDSLHKGEVEYDSDMEELLSTQDDNLDMYEKQLDFLMDKTNCSRDAAIAAMMECEYLLDAVALLDSYMDTATETST